MNRFLATTALALLLGAAPALAQSPDTPSSPPQEPGMQAPMQPESPSAIPSEPAMKAPDQSSEAAPILPDKSAKNLEQNAQFLNEQKADDILASTIIGKPAVNSQDESIGDVNDLVTDRSGKILAALIGVGGFLGIGEKDVGVPFKALEFRTEAEMQRSEDGTAKETDERRTDARDARFDAEHGDIVIVLATTKEDLEAAPDFAWLDEQDADSVKREQVVR